MYFFAHHHCDGRRIKQSLRTDIPSPFLQDRVAGGCQTRKIRHRCPGHKCDVGLTRQVKHIDQPTLGDLFDRQPDRRHHGRRGVLIPGACEPVGGQCSGQHAAGYESEVTPTRSSDGGAGSDIIKHADHICRVSRCVWQQHIQLRQARERFR